MKLPHAVLLGFMLIAAALFFGAGNAVVGQPSGPRGPFMIATGDEAGNMVWRVDQATGMVSYCYRDTSSLDRSFIKDRPPYCSGWGG